MSARYIGGLVYNPPGGWSGSFNGSSQYLTVASNAAFQFSTGDFTIELWLYMTALTGGNQHLIDMRGASAGATAPLLYVTSGGVLYFYTNGANQITGATLSASNWYHIALTRSGSTTILFVNGVQSGSVADTNNYIQTSVYIARASDAAGGYANGYISNVRIVKGTAVYTSAFTPPTGALLPITNTSLLTCRYPTFVDGSTNAFTITNNGTATVVTNNPFPTSVLPNPALGGAGNGIYTMTQYNSLLSAGTWPAYDPYYENTVLNLHGNAGTLSSFNSDASTNNFQVTTAGDTRASQYTPFVQNGYWSNYITGGSYETAPQNAAFSFGTGDFTVEFWINLNSYRTTVGAYYDCFVALGNYANSPYFRITPLGKADVGLIATGLTGTTTLQLKTWYHFAATRSGTSAKLFINGVLEASATSSDNLGNSSAVYIGTSQWQPANEYMDGYISNIRIVKGTAIYTSAFTPPTSPLTAVSGTSLLTAQSNRFLDNSTNAFVITPSGSPSVNPYQPFTAPTDTLTYGSATFDGSGDGMFVADNAALEPGSGNFSVECWVYFNTINTDSTVISKRVNSTSYAPFEFVKESTGNLGVWLSSSGSSWDVVSGGLVVAAKIGQWYHVVLARSGTTISWYVNGVRSGTTTSSATLFNNTGSFNIGSDTNGVTTNGYISNVRYLVGTSAYDATQTTYTVPTSPLTAITNTQLLTAQTTGPGNNNQFLDSSTNNFVITRNGNTTQGTFSPYGATWSNYFGGSGNYLSMADSTGFNLSGGNFTIECWIYPNGDYGNYNTIVAKRAPSSGSTAWELYLRTSTGVLSYFNGTNYESSVTPTANTWNHVAGVYDGTYINLYLNGTRVLQSAVGNTNISASVYIGTYPSYDERYIGYISNLRITKGAALYSGTTLTVPTAPLTNTVPSGNVVLLTCQNNRFVDDSAANGVITVTGSPTVQRFNPFGLATQSFTSYGASFDGSGDYVTAPSNAAFALGTGDYTFETWVYKTTSSRVSIVATSGGSGFAIAINTSGNIEVCRAGVAIDFTFTASISNNVWTHIAVTRSGTSLRAFKDGTLLGTQTSSTNYGQGIFYIAIDTGGTGDTFAGSMSNLRLVKGTALYTATFTVPTTPLTAVSGTSILTLQSTAFIDNSSNAFTLTSYGSAKPVTANPFGTSTLANVPYSANVIGGSGYFDGSGDWLTAPSNAGFGFGTGDFTIEGWVYWTGGAGENTFFCVDVTNGANIFLSSGGNWGIGTRGVAINNNFGTPPTQNVWNHLAVSRSGSTIRAFVNGVQVFSGSNSTNYATGSPAIAAIPTASGNIMSGYIADLRVVKGTAVYTAAFTPPTAPLTTVTNTQLLCNMQNAAIIDNGMANDLETLGNAQLSTNIKKYGSASIYLDGSGDYLTTRLNSSLQFGTGNFTVECWTYLISRANTFPCVFTNYNSYTSGALSLFAGHNSGNTSRYQVAVNGAGFPTIQSTTPIVYNTWVHLAVVRSSGTITLYVNGVANGTYNASGVTLNGVGSNWGIGTALDSIASGYLYGYIDEFRVTKGVARYTGNFTPPTSQVQDQ